MGNRVRHIRVLLFAALLFAAFSVFAEDPGSELSGTVWTKGQRLPVLGAKIEVVETGETAYAGERGEFSFSSVKPGTLTLVVSAVGHETARFPVTVEAGTATEVNLYLPVGGVKLDEIVVRERRATPHVADQTLTKEEMEAVPGAQNDPVRAVSNLPGVANTFPLFNTGGLVIRGQSGDESGYYLNGRRLPLLYHFGVLTFLYNAELIDEVRYLPGGYGVKYGNALGGVVDVKSRRPRTDRFGGVADLSNLSSFVIVESPVGKKHAVAAGLRRSFIDLFLPAVIPEDQASLTVSPSFWDYQFLFDYAESAASRIEITAFGAYDEVGLIAEESRDQQQVVTGTIGYTFHFHRQDLDWIFEPTARVQNRLTFSSLYSLTTVELGDDNALETVEWAPMVKNDFTAQLADWNRLLVGMRLMPEQITVDLGIVRPSKEGDPVDSSFSNDPIYQADEKATAFFGAFYIHDEIDAGRFVRITPGLRVDYMDYTDSIVFDPRLVVQVTPVEDLAIKLGLGQYHQFPEADEYVERFGNPDIGPENSLQMNLGAAYDFDYGILLDVQGYYKQLSDLIVGTGEGADVPYENTGKGVVYGAEVLLRKKLTDFWMGWVSYSYSVSRRKDRGSADWRWFDGDQRHNVLVVSTFGLPKGVRLGFRFQYSTGTPYTKIVGAAFNADTGGYVPIPADTINGERNPDLHQLDIRFDKVFTFNRWQLTTYLDIQNVYAQKQPFGYAYNYDYSRREMLSYPVILPSFGIAARF